MKLAILTSIDTRHRYFVRALAEHFRVRAVGYEETGYNPADVRVGELSESERAIVEEHYAERARQEERYFGQKAAFLETSVDCAVRRLPPGRLNAADTLAFLEEAGVDTVVVYGTNLIRPPLLDRWPGRMVNMHLGLSPYYRGTATNFYPLLNEEPEYVGATIHLIDAGIDSGPILRHARPEIVADDRPHTIGCKTILAGIEAMIGVLRDLDTGAVRPVPHWRVDRPRLYLRKDYHPRQVVDLYRKLDAGLIPKYVERAAQVAPQVRMVGPDALTAMGTT